MLTQIAAAALAAWAATGAPDGARDTTFRASEGARFEVQNRAGTIEVRGGDGDAVRVEVRQGPERALRVRRSGSVIRVSISERWRSQADDEEVDLLLEVPRSAGLRLQGVETAVRVTGMAGSVEAQTVDEDVSVRGPARAVRAQSVDGDVTVSGARGRVDLYTVDGDVLVSDVRGEVEAESIDGDLVFRNVHADRVDGSTMDGDVLFTGPIAEGGSYDLGTHDGDVWIGVPEATSAAFEVNLHAGSIDASFPLPGVETDQRGHVYRFTLGDGAARVELRSFDGVVFLRRPGELPDDRMPDDGR